MMVDDESVMECPECGASVSIDNENCPICGWNLKGDMDKLMPFKEERDRIWECPECGGFISPGSKICQICGNEIDEEKVKELMKKKEEKKEKTTDKEDTIEEDKREEIQETKKDEEQQEEREKKVDSKQKEEEGKEEEPSTEEENKEKQEKEGKKKSTENEKEEKEEKVKEKQDKEEQEKKGETKKKKKKIKKRPSQKKKILKKKSEKKEGPEYDVPKSTDMISLISPIYSYAMPWFLTLVVGLHFFAVVVVYPLVSPPEVLLYLTPAPMFFNESISAFALSFLVALALLLLTLKAYKFRLNILQVDKKKLIIPILVSIVITVSLGFYVYNSEFKIILIPNYIFFILSIFLIATQFDVLVNQSE